MDHLNAEDFISNFTYKRGVIFIDGWQRLKKGEAGDCDDFAITIARILSGNFMMFLWNVLTHRAQFWLVKSPQNKWVPRHIALHWRGRGWIDSTNRKWRDTPTPHTKMLPLPSLWVMFRVVTGKIGGKLNEQKKRYLMV